MTSIIGAILNRTVGEDFDLTTDEIAILIEAAIHDKAYI